MVRTHGSATCGGFRPASSRPRCARRRAWVWLACLLPDRLPAVVEDQPEAADETPAGEEPAEEAATPADAPAAETG